MSQKKQKNKKRSYLLTLFLAGSFSLSIGFRFLGFYHLSTPCKLGLILYLLLLLSIVIRCAVLPWLKKLIPDQHRLLWALGGSVVLGSLFFLLVDYRITPLRTVHHLTIENPQAESSLLLEDILLPGDQRVELAAAFPDAVVESDKLILSPGGVLEYDIEMTGGLTLDLSAPDGPLQPEILWDKTRLKPNIPAGQTIHFALDGASWGNPSPVYRLLGATNIAADVVSVGVIAFLVCALGLALFQNRQIAPPELVLRPAFAAVLVINLSLVVAGALIYHFAGVFDWTYDVLFAAGGILLGRLLIDGKIRRYLFAAAVVLVLGIVANLYFWRFPPNPPLLYLQPRSDNSFAFLADRIGATNSTYLSIGYYPYLRESTLHISQSLYDELMLQTYRLKALNQLADIKILDYQSTLTDDQVETLLGMGKWQSWPNRTGGTFHLQTHTAGSGASYCFFSDGMDYLIIPMAFLTESGVLDVSICE
jgi:hypothetical protein